MGHTLEGIAWLTYFRNYKETRGRCLAGCYVQNSRQTEPRWRSLPRRGYSRSHPGLAELATLVWTGGSWTYSNSSLVIYYPHRIAIITYNNGFPTYRQSARPTLLRGPFVYGLRSVRVLLVITTSHGTATTDLSTHPKTDTDKNIICYVHYSDCWKLFVLKQTKKHYVSI